MEIIKIKYDDYECLKISNEYYELIVTISVGPRILSFKRLDGENVLCDKGQFNMVVDDEEWNIIGGHRLWHSPESFPRTYFSDSHPVEFNLYDEEVEFVMNHDKSGIEKHISISFIDNKVKISHKLINKGMWPVKLAVWPITILRPGGTAYLRLSNKKTGYLPNRSIVFWDYTKINDERIKYDEDYMIIKQVSDSEPMKVGINSIDGYAEYKLEKETFIKEFDVVEDKRYPDMGCNLEVYTCDYMLELETLSPLTIINNNEEVIHNEYWSIKPRMERKINDK